MKIDYKEAFEKSRIAGSIAAGALDEVAKIVKPGITTNEIDTSVFVQTLKNHGVDRFFCVPGESYLSVMDELLYSPGISSRFYEGRYVSGQIAGHLSKTGQAGYVASFPIPEVMRGINAFLLGAQSVNPKFRMKVIWVNSWFDPDKEANAAKKLIDQGADILTQHTDSTAVVQIAEENKVLAFGQASDMTPFAPDYLLTSIINNWGDYYTARTKAVLDGSWFSTDTFGGMDVNMVVMGAFKNMPEQVKRSAKATTKALASGGVHPFVGPIIKQDGTTMVAEGEKLSLKALLGMDWYVQGVDVDPNRIDERRRRAMQRLDFSETA